MGQILRDVLFEAIFWFELLAAVLLFARFLAKRDSYWRRFPWAAVCCVAAIPVTYVTHAMQFGYVLLTCLAALLVWFLCDISWQDSLYCAICAYATQHFGYALNPLIFPPDTGWGFFGLHSILIQAAVYAAVYYLVAKPLPNSGRYGVTVSYSLISAVMFFAFATVLWGSGAGHSISVSAPSLRVRYIYDLFCCVFFLWVQVSQSQRIRAQSELAFQRELERQQREQYSIVSQNIDLINHKCHDLKYRIAALRQCGSSDAMERELQELEQSVQIYDAAFYTENKVLDTVLTEKSLYCEAHEITLNCVADGKLLDFMESTDIYSIFGNALDNAIEYVSRLDPSKRLITCAVWGCSGLLMIRFENYCDTPIQFKDGLPVTTKADRSNHGFGLRGIRCIANKYQGCVSVQAEHSEYTLLLSFPLEQQ